MTAVLERKPVQKNDYPTRDGRPMGETEKHRDIMINTIASLKLRFVPEKRVYISGNLLMFYEPGDKRKHVSPDTFVVFDHDCQTMRENYLIWEEGKTPDVVFEYTSKSTRNEDLVKKFVLYRDVLKVKEYFLFDPLNEYLKPGLQGHRLIDGEYVRIEPTADGRLYSEMLGLLLGREVWELRFYDPDTGERLPTPEETNRIRAVQLTAAEDARIREEHARKIAEEAAKQAEETARQAEEAARREQAVRQQVEAENERLRRELEEIRRKLSP